ncbi:SOS response-associated peptidase [Rhodococcus aetherivorans]|nr:MULTISPECIES: SOS response-associated peptidase [Rhodococcus]MDV6294897.1 SOS response-associated peptidase [Rhodococcus aetherivorans]WKW96876.1 SOS response-associated peptidase [Rhodococcus aetherivorans]
MAARPVVGRRQGRPCRQGWQGRADPYCMSPRDGSRLCTAGLWSQWSDPKSSREAVASITIRRVSAVVGSVRNHGLGLLAPASPAAEQLTLL